MYAVIDAGGKQERVAEGQTVRVEPPPLVLDTSGPPWSRRAQRPAGAVIEVICTVA